MSYTARQFSTLLKTDYCCCCKSTAGKHYISLYEEKSAEEALVEAIQNYGKKIVVEEDIGVVSTWYSALWNGR